MRVDHGRAHSLDNAPDCAGRRVTLLDARVLEILKEQRGAEDKRGHRGLARPSADRALLGHAIPGHSLAGYSLPGYSLAGHAPAGHAGQAGPPGERQDRDLLPEGAM